VQEPERADVFLVPFLLGCNAMLGWGHGMTRVNAAAHHAFFDDFDRFSREHLPHFSRWPHRHLFLFPLDSMFMPKWLGGSMLAHTGAGYRNRSRLDVSVPYLVSLPKEALDAPAAAARTNTVFLMASPSRNKVRPASAPCLRAILPPAAAAGRLYFKAFLPLLLPGRLCPQASSDLAPQNMSTHRYALLAPSLPLVAPTQSYRHSRRRLPLPGSRRIGMSAAGGGRTGQAEPVCAQSGAVRDRPPKRKRDAILHD
jgi:hypothetical protein